MNTARSNKSKTSFFTKIFNLRSNYRSRRAFAIILVAFGVTIVLQSSVRAQCVSLTTIGSAATQNFDTLSNTAGSTTNNLTIPGWFMTETGGGARDNEQYAVDTGASTTGDTYSYGAAAATDRAIGGLRSGTLIPNFGACYTNNTGTTINSLAVAYTGEEWRFGTAGRTDQINFEYSTNATDLVTGTWTNVSALNFVTPDTVTVGAKNGNAAADRTALSSTISSLSIPNGATFWIRWTDSDATGADDGLAVDDFSLTPQAATAAAVTVSGRVLTSDGKGIRNIQVSLVDQAGQTRTTVTTTFGYFRFTNLTAGETCTISVASKKYSFSSPTRVLSLSDSLEDVDFYGGQLTVLVFNKTCYLRTRNRMRKRGAIITGSVVISGTSQKTIRLVP